MVLRTVYAQYLRAATVHLSRQIKLQSVTRWFAFFVTYCSHKGDVFCPCHKRCRSDVHAHQELQYGRLWQLWLRRLQNWTDRYEYPMHGLFTIRLSEKSQSGIYFFELSNSVYFFFFFNLKVAEDGSGEVVVTMWRLERRSPNSLWTRSKVGRIRAQQSTYITTRQADW